ncbi:type I polyketide synthase [Nostoc sp. 'Lobaria pulmonaria (5183) cyanobiont']|uniref:type I polyketide synthase n=1 Tax=Nostoc sp. 'Lobaria pulmonaria (5183) cyanobiont' TaxID=1618022 RepID=UPI000CF35E57|nr:type I polyketide synthase [Nostoc sp. 'Lobaria pulmonaria (5183) cyanobiont']AVH69212.1 polyketide synthase [Nostoc sp. 'Lobaria pulmonaria (5183) cyanobiont']
MSTYLECNFNGLEIAIIGMTGRFPGAKNIEKFWQNLRDGIESIFSLSDEELKSSGIDIININDNYVKAAAILEEIELFDASFFGFNPREAEVIDPQQRIFLECAWSALENAGYDSKQYQGSIGVYAGTGISNYLINLYSNQNIRNSIDPQQLIFANDKDFLTTRVSYKLELEGPSVDVQTACSTSLVAVHLACRSLLSGECDIALAGGVAINPSQKSGYSYQEGGILSPDGHCRAFDAKGRGTVFGSGVGIVVLKRLEDALADGDCIHAVIKGSAINNDGALKVSYTAPRIDTQAKVIRTAQTIAEVDPETITYIEAHGTGTSLGDPIEIAALTQAFRAGTQKKGFCAIGSVKTNIGHLDTTAGVTGLIKTVLALKNKQIPPSLHFQQPNPQIDFDNSPFYVNTTLSEWKTNATPRRAGVSSFGIGGTNAHVILEEAPPTQPSGLSRPWQLLLLSAKTESALETATKNLVTHLKQHPELNLADIAYTLQVGRRAFEHRCMLVCQDYEDAVTVLENLDSQRTFTHFQEPCNRQIVFMFPGQGSQYVNMGRDLYESEPVFRTHIDDCCEILKSHLGIDLRTILYPDEGKKEVATPQLQQTQITQPALFVIEYALAQLWIAWGISPVAMIGHSIGEYVAACLAGVFSLEDALTLVATRGRLMQQIPSGAMLSVALSEKAIKSYLDENLSLAAINAPSLCVVSGSEESIDQLQQELQSAGVSCRRLYTNHAFHSQMMDSILEVFTEQIKKVNLNPPKIPFISNLTGTWISTSEATNPSYWTRHLRHTVRFAMGIAELIKDSKQVLLEVGPGRTLNTFAKQQTDDAIVLSSMRHPKDQQSDVAFLLNTLGRLWLAGVQVDWYYFYSQEQRHRIPLPTYPFERQRYWIEAPSEFTPVNTSQELLGRKPNIADWFYTPSWERDIPLEYIDAQKQEKQKACWLIFIDTDGIGSQIAERLKQEDQDFITISVGQQFSQLSSHAYTINPQKQDDYDALLQALRLQDLTPNLIAHLWGITLNAKPQSNKLNEDTPSIADFENYQFLSFYSLLFLAQALGKHNITTPIQITVVTNKMQDVIGDEQMCPEKATVLGPCIVIPQEYPNIVCRSIDVVIPELKTWQADKLVNQLIAELKTLPNNLIIAYRGGNRWIQTFKAVCLDKAIKERTRLKKEGIYLIAGDLIEGLGLVFAEYLAQAIQAKLILIENSNLPEKNEWEQWLTTHNEQDNVSSGIRKIQALEKSGIEFLIMKADMANEKQMLAAINQAYKHFGVIHGVFYVPEIAAKSANLMQDICQADCELQFKSKVCELLVLDEVLQGKKIDFCLVQSSLSTILGGLGLVAYSAAYHFIDTFVRQKNQTSSIPWFTINRQAFHSSSEQEQEVALTELAMTPKEVWESFELVLSMGSTGQVVVSTGDLQARLEQAFRYKSLQELDNYNQSLQADSLKSYSRPRLQTTYIAPSNEIEQRIANVWQEILGVEQIGVHDNFFELGGHSLLAVQVTSRLREIFQVELPLQTILFDAPTVAGLANVISARQPQQEDTQEIAALLQEIKSLSLEEIQQEIATDS